MSDDELTIDVRGLDALLKAFENPPVIRVGILGDGQMRHDEKGAPTGKTNAEIGAVHEFGGNGMPVRSFLRLPLTAMLDSRLESAGLFTDAAMLKILQTGTFLEASKKIAAIAEGIVIEAFNTGGYGTWKPSDMRHKKVHQTLVESQQLRNAITSEVKEA